MAQKVLVIAAHPDDEILGVGGTALKHTKAGDEVYCVIAAEGIGARYSDERNNLKEVKDLHVQSAKAASILGYKEIIFLHFPDNRMDSVDLLDVIKKIEEIVEKIKPDIIYTHHPGDVNIDHNICFKAAMTAARPIGKEKVLSIYTFETLSSTEWQIQPSEAFNPNTYVDIESEIEQKLDAMKQYVGEIRDYPHSRSLEGIRILAQFRGLQSGIKFAEAFCLMKRIII